MNENQLLREALLVARDHIDMAALNVSHCKDAALIRAALAQPAEGGEVVAHCRGVMEHMMLVAQRAAESVDRALWSPKAERRAICKAILADKNLLRKLRDVAPPASQERADCEPFGYFRPEPFGWTDCEKEDEGAVALYERPQVKRG